MKCDIVPPTWGRAVQKIRQHISNRHTITALTSQDQVSLQALIQRLSHTRGVKGKGEPSS